MQWLKRYFDINYNGEPYDAVGRRKGADFFYLGGTGVTHKPAAPSKIQKKTPAPVHKEEVASKPKPVITGIKKTGAADKENVDKKTEDLTNEIQELKMTCDTLEKERDFYFGKLRDIEVLLQA